MTTHQAMEADERPEHVHYDTVEEWILQSINWGSDFLFDSVKFDQEIERMWEEYDFHPKSLLSFIRNLHLTHVKRTAHRVKSALNGYLERYLAGESIKSLAEVANFPPYMMARYFVERMALLDHGKKSLTDAMRNPAAVLGSFDVIAPPFRMSEISSASEDGRTRLSLQVQEAIECDPLYGPRHDRMRHFVGVEYEFVLEEKLRAKGIAFETESDLRERGTSKTPDVLLCVPLAIEVPAAVGKERGWKVICWIDSKALFGDVKTHNSSVLPQAETYVHRFGPGLILYWFGHAPLDRLDDAKGDVVISSWSLPDRYMTPTGEIRT